MPTSPPRSAALRRGIRAELRGLVAEAGRRRVLVPRAYVGVPGRVRVELPDPRGPRGRGAEAPGLRADLVVRALDGLPTVPGSCGWVTRSGELGPTDDDVAWMVATRDGLARHGCDLDAFFVVNRQGWVDLVGGDSRTWVRLRPRLSPASGSRRVVPGDLGDPGDPGDPDQYS